MYYNDSKRDKVRIKHYHRKTQKRYQRNSPQGNTGSDSIYRCLHISRNSQPLCFLKGSKKQKNVESFLSHDLKNSELKI